MIRDTVVNAMVLDAALGPHRAGAGRTGTAHLGAVN